jgi:two-component system LytT family sensor kinase
MRIVKKYSLIPYHLAFWLAYLALYSLRDFAAGDPKSYVFSIPDIVLSQLPNIIVVYLSIYVFLKYAVPTKIVPLITGIILIYVFDVLIWYSVSYMIIPFFQTNGPPLRPFNLRTFSIDVLWVFIKYCVFGFGYAFARIAIMHEKKILLVEKEKIEAEYAFLRAQINPHFLNNTLNFFYAKALPLSAELSDGIITLSQIMRYSLDKDEKNRMVMLTDEAEHVSNVIKINQMRLNDQLYIELNIGEFNPSIQVVPLVFITVVENILKHGDYSQPDNPAMINLFVTEDGNFVHLKTYNKKKNPVSTRKSGIGIENINQRLYRHYGDSYKLVIHDHSDFYVLELKLPVIHMVEFFTSFAE